MGVLAACGPGAKGPASDKIIKSTTSGGLTISLASDTGEIKSGDSELVLLFTDESGKPVDVGAASLTFHMPGMGSMAEMNDAASLTTTTTPGRYRARVNIEMAGTWDARIGYQGSKGTGQVTLSVSVR